MAEHVINRARRGARSELRARQHSTLSRPRAPDGTWTDDLLTILWWEVWRRYGPRDTWGTSYPTDWNEFCEATASRFNMRIGLSGNNILTARSIRAQLAWGLTEQMKVRRRMCRQYFANVKAAVEAGVIKYPAIIIKGH